MGILALWQGRKPLAYHASGQLCRADVSQVGASPFGFEALTVYAFVLEPYPAMPCFNGGSFSSSCWLGLVLHVLCAEFASGFVSLWAETPHPSQNMGSAGLSMPVLSPLFACLRPAFVVPT